MRSARIPSAGYPHPLRFFIDCLLAAQQRGAVALQCDGDHRQEFIIAVGFDMFDELSAHAGIPKALDMAGRIVCGNFGRDFRLEEGADLIGHLDQTFDFHSDVPESVVISRSEWAYT